MLNSDKSASYIDEYQTKTILSGVTEEDLRLTETINSSRNIAIMQRQNELYEKEIKELRRTGTITMWAAIIAAISAIVATVLQITMR